MNKMKIESLKIENFRAFKGTVEFDIDPAKPIVLLYGNNGFGKTSFFDAVEWSLTGKLARYEGSAKERNEYGMLRNQFIKGSAPAGVSIGLSSNKVITRTIRKSGQGDYNEGAFKIDPATWIVKPASSGSIDFGQAFSLSHLLTQELVSRFVRSTKDTDRYAAIVSLFGLDGVTAFNPQFDEISKSVLNIRGKFEREIETKMSEVARHQTFLNTGDIDNNAMRAELASLLSCEAQAILDYNELLATTQQKGNEGLSNIEVLKSDINMVSYLEQNWQKGQTVIGRVVELGKALMQVQKLAEACKSLSACQWIISVKDAYLKYREDVEVEPRLKEELRTFEQTPHGRLLSVPDLSTDGDITPLFVLGPALGHDLANIVNKIQTNTELLIAKKTEIEKFERIIDAKFGLEKRLLQLAKEFFIDNPATSECPVCRNGVKSTEILSELETRLHQDVSDIFKETSDTIAQLRYNLSSIVQEEVTLKTSAVEAFNAARRQAAQNIEDLKKRFLEANQLTENGVIVESWLNHLKVDIDNIEATTQQLQQTIQISPFFNTNKFSEDFYKKQHEDLNSELIGLQKQNEYFNELVGKFKPATMEDILKTKDSLNAAYSELLKNKAQLDRSKEILIALQKDERNSQAIMKIVELEKEVSVLQDKIKKLKSVPDDCNALKQAARQLIENDTRKLLDDYGETIEQIYTHINPHAHIAKLKFRTDGSNKSNNRLIFEALTADEKTTINPTYTFSSAQTNVLAISIFLGIALRQQWSNLNALFLDDPIQNMDDINVHSFVDIIRSVVRDTDKQFFISTHDERVFQFMKRKFRNTAQVFKFTGYGEFEKLDEL